MMRQKHVSMDMSGSAVLFVALVPVLYMMASNARATAGDITTRRVNSFNDTMTEARPVFRPTSRNITVGPGDRAVLKCRVENLGTKTVTWRRQGDVHPLTIGLFQFAPDTRLSVDYNQRTAEWSLIIQDVRPTDEGYYHCQLSTKYERDSYDIKLNVRTILVTGTDYVERGSSVRLTCNATGRPDPPHDVGWFKDGQQISANPANEEVIITKKIETKALISVLSIKHAKTSDAGTYICRSSTWDSGYISVYVLNGTASFENRAASFSERYGSGSGGGGGGGGSRTRNHATQSTLGRGLEYRALTVGLLLQRLMTSSGITKMVYHVIAR